MFKGRHFDRSVILLCVRWYLADGLSLRNLEEMMAERGISVDYATIHRWIIRYSPELLARFNARKRAVTGWSCFGTMESTSYNPGGAPCPRHALRRSFGMRRYGCASSARPA
jgi:hypothetical protein